MPYRKALAGCLVCVCVVISSMCQAQTHPDSTRVEARDSITGVMADGGIEVREDGQIEQQERLTVWAVAVVLLGGLGFLLDRKRKECDRQAGIS